IGMRFGCRGPRRSTASVRTGGHAFAPGAGAPTGRSWDWLCCRSTALGAKGVGTHSHPGRVLLRVGVGFGLVVGAPPRCERGGHAFAPGAGAPTGRSWVWFCCRSTASVRTGRARCEPGGVGFWFWGAKVSRSCADFLSCSPVFGVPCLFRLPLVLLLGAALPAQAMTFQTRMEDVQWSVEGDKFECRLSQRVDGYGEAVFIRRAGERPMFQLSAWSELMRPGAAQLYN